MNTKELLQRGTVFLTDGGLETDLIFNKGIDLPHNAAFTLYEKPRGKIHLYNYYRDYIQLALKHKINFLLESPTWRCNPDWGYKLGYSEEEIRRLNGIAIEHMMEIRKEFETLETVMLISGNVGPRGDGYIPHYAMSDEQAELYHAVQIKALKDAGADLVSAFTMNYINEALGIVRAATKLEMPVVISFTLETDGRLPDGSTLEHAINQIDNETQSYPLYYMINCAHPHHFKEIVVNSDKIKSRIKGIRANSSTKSHEELDNSEVWDKGDKHLLADEYKGLKGSFTELTVIGGCCGTDHTHLEHICNTLFRSNS